MKTGAARGCRAARLDLADSALHASAARLGQIELYAEVITKAAVLVVQLDTIPHRWANKRIHGPEPTGCSALSMCSPEEFAIPGSPRAIASK